MKNTYIITGAGKGMGQVFARTVAKIGGNLALISRTSSDLEKFKKELLQINADIKISIHPADLSDPDQTRIAFDSIDLIHGKSIKCLVCFAGSWIKSKVIEELETTDFLEGIQSNLFTTFNSIKETLRICDPQLKGLTIITIGSTSGVWMNPEAPVMSIAKAAVSNYSRILAKQLLPKEVHVAHIVIDGMIFNKRGIELSPNLKEDHYIQPESIAKEIHHVINQSQDAWTFEWDIRPYTRNTRLI